MPKPKRYVVDLAMHELSLVDELVATCRSRANGRTVQEVWVRCPTTVNPAELSVGFAMAARQLAVSAGDPSLEAAELKLELVPVHLRCACGYEGQLSAEDLAGHMSVCPQCAHIGEADACLELVGMSFADAIEPFGPI
jgi:Zn finger protein HypA/HybF involved in hydrogenase expression